MHHVTELKNIYRHMTLHFYKYQGTGNDFVMLDNRTGTFPKEDTTLVNKLCDRRFGIGADGLILLEKSDTVDFTMVYYNADGNESSMCGNGGRCLVAFAKQLKVIKRKATFTAIDGLHHATIKDGVVSLQMIDVTRIESYKSHTFLNTGSPHHIEFVANVDAIDIQKSGKEIRYGAPYYDEGTNVNFVEVIDSSTLKVRTYERGVEDETLSCGTGVTAAAIAAYFEGKTTLPNTRILAQGGDLSVSFDEKNKGFYTVVLTGPATFVFEGTFKI